MDRNIWRDKCAIHKPWPGAQCFRIFNFNKAANSSDIGCFFNVVLAQSPTTNVQTKSWQCICSNIIVFVAMTIAWHAIYSPAIHHPTPTVNQSSRSILPLSWTVGWRYEFEWSMQQWQAFAGFNKASSIRFPNKPLSSSKTWFNHSDYGICCLHCNLWIKKCIDSLLMRPVQKPSCKKNVPKYGWTQNNISFHFFHAKYAISFIHDLI